MTQLHLIRCTAPVLVLLLSLLSPNLVWAQDDASKSDEEPFETTVVADPVRFTTEHQGTFGGRALTYSATAGETHLLDEKGLPSAAIFSFAYTVAPKGDDPDAPNRRPVAFVWNGGPGSSSVWLHMGTFGPKRVDVPSDAADAGLPPYDLLDNPDTPLDLVDLVFVDPVGTGFSRAVGEHENKEFWGLEQDARSIADFIQAWVTEHGRWNSPKYLIGESFGTTRAAAVAGLLEDGSPAIRLSGLVLVSQALDYEGSTPSHDNTRSYITYLPTLAATAWYHGKVEVEAEGTTLEQFLEQAREFAYQAYAPALLRGSSLDDPTRSHIAERLAYFTGLDQKYVERSDLRILADRFRKELLRDEGRAVGRIDGRYVGDDIDDVAERPDGDPSGYGIDGAYTATLHEYMQRHLGIEIERPYKVSGGRELGSAWSWKPLGESSWEPQYVNVSRRLSRAMRRNPSLRVLVASGYYDFATPFFDAEITFDRYGIPRDRVVRTYYEAGHMMYLHGPSMSKFLADVRTFLKSD
jgi:carboxypeptidase C (cathepsin A)